jgi:hypothetical protein
MATSRRRQNSRFATSEEVHRFTATTALRPETAVESESENSPRLRSNKKDGSKTELLISSEEMAELRQLQKCAAFRDLQENIDVDEPAQIGAYGGEREVAYNETSPGFGIFKLDARRPRSRECSLPPDL